MEKDFGWGYTEAALARQQPGRTTWKKKDLPKAIKRDMRTLIGLAHETELAKALDELHGDFERWKSGEIDSFELSDRIHRFHDGPNREIYLRYTGRVDARYLVEYALEEGLIQKAAVPKEVWPFLGGVRFRSPLA